MGCDKLDELFQSAVSKYRTGDLAGAIQCCRKLLARDRKNLRALQLLGILLCQQGSFGDGLPLLQQVATLQPGDAEAQVNLAVALNRAGRNDEAVACLEPVVAQKPHHALALNNLGIALRAIGRRREAMERFRQALAAAPDYAEARSNLAAELLAAGQPAAAIEHLQRVLTQHPGVHEARLNLGSAFAQLGRHEEASAMYKDLVRIRPKDPAIRRSLGSALHKSGHTAEAIRHLEIAVEQDPQNAGGHSMLGSALLEVGRIQEGRQHLRRAVELAPDSVPFLRAVVFAETVGPDDQVLARLLDRASRVDTLGVPERIDMHFALGKALTDTGDPAAGFQHQIAGNAMLRSTVTYPEEGTLARMERSRAIFTPALLDRLRGIGDPDETPIFIVGMPRSGSTLIEQILAAHPQVFSAGELMAFREAARHTGLEQEERRFPDTMAEADADQLRAVAAHYKAAVQSLAKKAGVQPLRITDKMPANHRYVGLIHVVFPKARIIHSCRDPIDTCLSCFASQLRQGYNHDLGELGRYWRGYDRLMRHWHSVLPPGVILDVRYEDLIADVETWARRIVAHCGLPWDEACLNFQSVDRAVRTASVVQVRQPIYRSSIGRWRPDAETLRPLLEGLGMEMCSGGTEHG